MQLYKKPHFRIAGQLLLLLVFAVMSLSLYAGNHNDGTSEQRLKIGLALSGGGARGAAHVGVLKVLEEMQVPIDYIAGTSMGAVIGGLYASGMKSKELEQALLAMEWGAVFQDQEQRIDRSFHRKQDDRLYLSKLKPGVKQGEVKLKTALVQGQKFDLVLNRLTKKMAYISDFDDMEIPFRAVAADIATGKEVVLKEGNLAQAIRASMSVPAVFSGVELNNQLLVDGGIANNLPVSVVKAMGADIVIAIDISARLYDKQELSSALNVLDQLSSLLTRSNTEKQIAMLSEQDILIVPDFGNDITSADFDKIPSAIELGWNAANQYRSRFSKFASNTPQLVKVTVDGPQQMPVLNFIRIENDSILSDQLLKNHLGLYPGDKLDLDILEKGIGRIYGLDIFSNVRYELVSEAQQNGLVVHAAEKSWGTSFFQFGMELATDTDAGESMFNLAASYTHMPLNELNGEWRTAVQFGEEPGLTTEIYQPLDVHNKFFVFAEAARKTEHFSVSNLNHVFSEYEANSWGLDMAVGFNLDNWGEVRGGYRWRTGEVKVTTGVGLLDDYDFNSGELYLRFTIDELDNAYFPEDGYAFIFNGSMSREYLGADEEFEQFTIGFAGAKSRGRNTLLARFIFNTTLDDDAPFESLFRLGGFQRLSGLNENQLSGQQSAFLGVGYQRKVYASKILPIYAGVTAELGNTWDDFGDISLEDSILAGSLYLGADTLLGPLYLGYGHAEGGNNSVYLFLGSPWY